MSFLYTQAQPGHFFSERVPQRTFTSSPVSTFNMARGWEHGCSPFGTASNASPWNRHFEAVSPFGLAAFSSTDIAHLGRNAEHQKCHGFVMALSENHASNERKHPAQPRKIAVFRRDSFLHGGCRGFESLIAHGFLQSSVNGHSFAPVCAYPLTARDCSIACCNRIYGTVPSYCRCSPVEKYQPICRYSEESAPLIFLCPLRNIPPSAVSHRAVCEQQDHR